MNEIDLVSQLCDTAYHKRHQSSSAAICDKNSLDQAEEKSYYHCDDAMQANCCC